MRMGENASNPDFDVFLRWMKTILEYRNNTGSVNLYMAHGGTNFGWSMGESPFLFLVLSTCYTDYALWLASVHMAHPVKREKNPLEWSPCVWRISNAMGIMWCHSPIPPH